LNPSPTPDGNDQEPDTQALQCLLDQGGTISLNADTSFAYFVGPPGLVLRRTGTTLTSFSNYGYRALIEATADLSSPLLQIESGAVTGYTISNVWFYGNRFNRNNPDCNGQSPNLLLRGSSFLIDNIASDTAPCNTSTVTDGSTSNFEIRNSWFTNNGWGQPELPGGSCTATKCWADGLTLNQCIGGYVHDNHFRDNTDVDLVVGGGWNCTIEYNNIDHSLSYGFAGIHIGWFPGAGNGNHAGNTYRNNTVTSSFNKLAFGVVAGLHPWNVQQQEQVSDAGLITGNTSSGAVVPLAVDGITSGTFDTNSAGGAQGNLGMDNCTVPLNFTAADFGSAFVQGGWIHRFYHNGSCGG
jgi:hypothetical protein